MGLSTSQAAEGDAYQAPKSLKAFQEAREARLRGAADAVVDRDLERRLSGAAGRDPRRQDLASKRWTRRPKRRPASSRTPANSNLSTKAERPRSGNGCGPAMAPKTGALPTLCGRTVSRYQVEDLLQLDA